MEWQNDPKQIKTNWVQYWKNGIMLTAQLSKENAQELVRTGEAFVISSQAVGAIINEKKAG